MNFFTKASLGMKLLAIGGVLLLLATLFGSGYFIGLNKGKGISATEIGRYEGKISELRGQAAIKVTSSNDRVVTQYVDRVVHDDQVLVQNRDVVKWKVVNRDIEKSVTCGWIYAHNQAVAQLPIDPELAADPESCGVLDNAVLDQVIVNYNIANKNSDQLRALQELQRQREKIYTNVGTGRLDDKKGIAK